MDVSRAGKPVLQNIALLTFFLLLWIGRAVLKTIVASIVVVSLLRIGRAVLKTIVASIVVVSLAETRAMLRVDHASSLDDDGSTAPATGTDTWLEPATEGLSSGIIYARSCADAGFAYAASGVCAIASELSSLSCAYVSHPDGTRGCSACPHDQTSWSAYQGPVFIFWGVFGFVGIVYLLLALLGAHFGGSIRSTAGHAGQLLAWAITMLQGVAQVAAVTSSTLPPFLSRMFSFVSVFSHAGGGKEGG